MRKALTYITGLVLILTAACKGLETDNDNNPDRELVLSSGADLISVLGGGYVSWWQAVHGEHPAIALSVSADAYGMSWGNFGAQRMGEEPRAPYNNRSIEEPDYRQVAEDPWYGCLSAVSSANDVLAALDRGVSIDNGGPQDDAVRAAAHFLRGVSWGYLGLIFDKALLADTDTDLSTSIPFTPYSEVIDAAVAELETAIELADAVGDNFVHNYFNGLIFGDQQFEQLCHSYAARFLAQWPRTQVEAADIDWSAVLAHAEKGIDFNFSPEADGKFWTSYQRFVFAEAGQGPFWARVDQRLIAAFDPSQPARYPEVWALGEPPLANPMATSTDTRLLSDFVFLAVNNFPAERGEWHYSHYKHNRNISDPGFAGDGFSGGPMPAFLAADNALLRAEALLRLQRNAEAIAIINAGTRTTRGHLSPLNAGADAATVEQAIAYERAIELLGTAPMSLWFDRRRLGPRQDYLNVEALGGLQTGTPAQLPVPASELRIRNEAPYNYGGPLDPEGIDPVY
jgi:hypothetical protein